MHTFTTTLDYNAHFTSEKDENIQDVKYTVFLQIYISCPFLALHDRELHFPGFLSSDFCKRWPMGGTCGMWEGGRRGEVSIFLLFSFCFLGHRQKQLLLLLGSIYHHMGFSPRSQFCLASFPWF